ncbi:MAG TPA: AAA family ATPase [Candidatus Limnocylindrales bacterium]
MRILRLQLHGIGRHRDLDITLSPGFTIVRGPNEAGKSTIQRGLELALFRKPTAQGAEIDELKSWGIRADESPSVRLEFVVEEEDEDAGGIVALPGVLEKEYRGQRGRVALAFNGQMYTDPAKAEQVIADLTGIPSEQFFRSTASIRHEELDDLDRDEGALRDRLQASIGGGNKGSSRAKNRLEEAVRNLKSRGEKNPGRLKIAEEAVARADIALKSGEAALEKLEHDRDALAQARSARARAESLLAESRNMFEGARQAERLRSDRTVIAERFERYRQAAEAQARLRELEAMPERSISALRDSLDRVRTLQSRVSILQETLHEERGPEVEPDEPEKSYRVTAFVAGIILLASVGLLFYGVTSGVAAVTLGGLLLGLAAGASVYVFWERRSAAVTIRRANDTKQRERTLRRQGRVSAEEGLRVAQSGVANLLRELGVPDTAAAERLLTGEQARRQDIATLQVQVSALLGGQKEDGVQTLRDQAALELEQKTAALGALGPIATDARARERLEAEVRERHDFLERARDSEAAAIARVDANPVDAEQVAGESERLVSWREQLAALQRRVRVYEATLAAIVTAEHMTMRKATRFLEQHVGRDLSRLTGGRYRRIEIDDSTLDFEIWAPERGDWVPASRLSKGTIDQIYLAARIGLVRLVTQGRRPPLILDDPFVTFDDTRAARAALLLRELSSDFQVIYLACSNRYDGLADAVVELPGPADAESASASQAASTPVASTPPLAQEDTEAEPEAEVVEPEAEVVEPENLPEPEPETAEPEPETAEPEAETAEPEPVVFDPEAADIEPQEPVASESDEAEPAGAVPESGGDSSDSLGTTQAGDAEATDTEATVWHAEAD